MKYIKVFDEVVAKLLIEKGYRYMKTMENRRVGYVFENSKELAEVLGRDELKFLRGSWELVPSEKLVF